MHLKFTDITVSTGEKVLIQNVYGDVKPGEVMAIMGPSGAGKTTLMSLLAGRAKKHELKLTKGRVTVNNNELDKGIRRNIGYVPQEDTLFCYLTVRQTLHFYGNIRLTDDIPKSEKIKRVEEIIESFGLSKCADTIVGGPHGAAGVSGGERKRTSIAAEIINMPPLLLMDEPTTGLDSSTASNLIQTLKNMARKQNQAIITTIHQPSSNVFHKFDKVMFLCNGRVAYFGDIPSCMNFFSTIGMSCYQNWNPADFIMEQLTSTKSVQDKICNKYSTSDDFTNYTRDQELCHISKSETSNDSKGSTDYMAKSLKWSTGFCTQFAALCKRAFIQTKADNINWNKFALYAFHTTCISLIWSNLPYIERTLPDRKGIIFLLCLMSYLNTFYTAVMAFPSERNVIIKERTSGMYRLSAYFLAKCASELPLVILFPSCLYCIVYWATGMNPSAYFLLSAMTVLLNIITGQSLGLLIGILFKDFQKAFTFAVVTSVLLQCLAGFFKVHMPFWLSWAKYLNTVTFTYDALLRIEFNYNQQTYQCADVASSFSQCYQNKTSLPYQQMLGYGSNTSSMTPVITGKDVYNFYSPISFTLWQSWAVMIGYIIVVRSACYLGLKFFHKPTKC